MTLTLSPRSVRNNNPGNLEIGQPWEGLSHILKDDPYCVFVTPVHGFRALAIDLRSKWKHGLTTIEAIVTRRSPPSENPTEAVIKTISDMMGVARDASLDLNGAEQLAALCRAIAVQEAGSWLFSTNDLNMGVQMAMRA